MSQNRFHDVTRSMTRLPSRRDLLRGLAGAGLGLGIVPRADLVEARKKRKKRKKKDRKKETLPQPNAFGCLEIGDVCNSETDCCSGICAGAEGKQTCQAHGTGNCPQAHVGICLATADEIPVLKCGNNDLCFCYTTTSGSNFCGTRGPRIGEKTACADCQKDADCAALGFPAGSACAPVGNGYCSGQCPTGMACIPPCGVELPSPDN
jgi:hypothetical protein